jgi:opacity protein-like surface antigen
MIHLRFMGLFALVVVALSPFATPASAEQWQQSAQLRAGGYFPASKSFEVGSGIDLAYSVKPFPYAALEAGIGYYRAENGNTGFLSALPLTISATAILPLQIISLHAGGGVGTYYKMAGGTTELPADHSEFSLGYHLNAGFEFPAFDGVSLLVEGRYVFVNQGKFKSYDIKHDGAFAYGGFALNF